jgi:hypothetical protein
MKTAGFGDNSGEQTGHTFGRPRTAMHRDETHIFQLFCMKYSR